MHIALQIFTANPQRGGMERYTHDLANALLHRDHDVTTIATTFANDWPGKHQRVDVTGSRASKYAIFAAATTDADVIHAMQPVEHCDLYQPHSGFAPQSYASKGPLHTLANRFNAKRRLVQKLEAALMRTATIACLSQRQADEARQHYATQRLHVVHHGIDLDRFDPDAVEPANLPGAARPTVLFVAQNFRWKRLGFALEVIARCSTRPRLAVVGRDDAKPFRKQAERLGIDERVIFVGEVADTAPYHAAADALILPTLDEPFGLVVLESIAMGNPVVLYETAGAAEIVNDGATGRVLSDPHGVAAWARELDIVLDANNDHHTHCLAQRPALAFDRHVDRLIDLYRQV
ncbi:MAG: glycosyltransferase family 4 protein [Planctomycetota bacterium]